MKRNRAILFLLPNLFTVSSIFCGMYAIFLATGSGTDRFFKAAVAIIFAVLFDSADGRVARATRTQSEFGIQMDSLADAISFGVAPAVLVYKWALFHFGLLGMVVAFIYATCGVMRLARFNVQASQASSPSHYFTGLPIPLAAANLVSLVLVQARSGGTVMTAHPLLLVVVLLLSVLMVSRVRYRTFKAAGARQAGVAALALLVLVLVALVKTGFALMFMGVMAAMLALGPAEELLRLVRRRLPDNGDDAEDAEQDCEEESV